MDELRIVFMGTPEFAVPSLEVLVENKLNVVAVVTAPDKPQGRGQKLTSSPIKEFALKYGIPVLQPVNLKSPAFLEELKSYGANLQVVVAFRMLPESIWTLPSFGTFNLHASLLPQYRGAAPINWAIINGETETGLTTFFLKHEIDTGSIIFQEKESILDSDDAGSLYERLKNKGSQLVLKTVNAIAVGSPPAQPQQNTKAINHAPKIFKETCRIDWDKTADQIRNLVRGLSPYPGAWTTLNGKNFKISKVTLSSFQGNGNSGDFIIEAKNYLYVRATDRWISVDVFQPEGKRLMSVKEYLAGNSI